MTEGNPTAKPGPGAGKTLDQQAQDVVEGRTTPSDAASHEAASSASAEESQPAGPHADPALMSDISTPGAGALAPIGGQDDVEAASG